MAKSDTNEPTCCARTESGILLFRFDPSIDPSCPTWVSTGNQDERHDAAAESFCNKGTGLKIVCRGIAIKQSADLTWPDQPTNLGVILNVRRHDKTEEQKYRRQRHLGKPMLRIQHVQMEFCQILFQPPTHPTLKETDALWQVWLRSYIILRSYYYGYHGGHDEN